MPVRQSGLQEALGAGRADLVQAQPHTQMVLTTNRSEEPLVPCDTPVTSMLAGILMSNFECW